MARLRRGWLLAWGMVAVILGSLLAWRLVAMGGPNSRSGSPSASSSGSRSSSPSALNIVFVLTDDQRWDTLGVMPEVRRLLGGHGVTFSNAFVTTSMCCPSRATILTGRYSRHTGVYQNTLPHGGGRSFDDRSTVATWLRDAGYTTGLVGKYLNGYELLPTGYVPPGWDEWDVIARGEFQYYGYDLNENGRIVSYGMEPEDYSTTVLAEKALRFVREADRPFFLYFAPIAPHQPAVPAPEDEGAYSGAPPWQPASYDEPDVSDKPWRSMYGPLPPVIRSTIDQIHQHILESLRAVDRSVAALVQELRARGELDRTVIVFTSDNGFLWGEHRLKGKIWPYEESIRVPLVARVPWLDHGRVDRRLVTNADLASTFAELGEARPGLPQDGRSLLPLLRGKDVRWPKSILVEYLGPPGVNVFGPPPFEAIRTERYLYVEYQNGWHELYDLREDPHQLRNEYGTAASAALQRRLAGALRELLKD